MNKTTDIISIRFFVEIFSITALLFVGYMLIIYYSELPNTVPSHYNICGEADAYSHKWVIFIVPFLMIITYIALSILQRKPHIFNYPIQVTDENRDGLYKVGVEMVVVSKMLVMLMFAALCASCIFDSINKKGYVNIWFILIPSIGLLIVPIYYIVKMYTLKSKVKK